MLVVHTISIVEYVHLGKNLNSTSGIEPGLSIGYILQHFFERN
jgi:hypothetical protein